MEANPKRDTEKGIIPFSILNIFAQSYHFKSGF